MIYEITVKELAPQPTAAVRVTIRPDQLADTFDDIFPTVWRYLEEQGITPTGAPFARYHRYTPEEIDLEAGLPVPTPIAGTARIRPGELPGGQVATTWHLGPFDTLPQAYEAIDTWLAQQQWTAAGTPWEVYWTDPREVADPSELRTEVLWPVR